MQADWIGSDEAGKGDYFGPLVIAAVLVDSTALEPLWQLGVKDSKRLADASVERLAVQIRGCCVHAIVAIGPEKYNYLYSKIQNLNRLLAWGHARAIENILNRKEASYALADQFGDENFLVSALMSKGRTIQVRQETRAESDIAVAAASILARREFLRRLGQLSAKYHIELPKGASPAVIQAGKEFITRYGSERLKEVAKIHFRTTRSVLTS
jgi:ribonuclease HIII